MQKLSGTKLFCFGTSILLLLASCENSENHSTPAGDVEIGDASESIASGAIAPAPGMTLLELEKAHDNFEYLGIYISHKLLISGNIEPDAFEKFRQSYAHSRERGDSLIISLNSGGGSVSQALLIAQFIAENEIPTVVEEGAECYSACAFVFMAGRWGGGGEGPGGVLRLLHINAKLGFHAPFLAYSPTKRLEKFNGTYGNVANAYEAGLQQIGTLLSSSYSTGTRWPASLVGEMLLTPPHEFREILTVDDAGRWNIELIGTPHIATTLTPRQRYFACSNFNKWADEELWHVYENLHHDEIETEEKMIDSWVSAQEKMPDQAPYTDLVRVPIDELNNLVCYIGLYPKDEDNPAHISIRFEGEDYFAGAFPLWKAYDPDFKIAELPQGR